MARTQAALGGELSDGAVHVMLALVEPRHGYAIMQFLDERSGGTITMGPASLYTTLKKLVASKLIEELDDDASRRTYRLTPVGREALVRNIDHRRRLVAMAENILEQA